MDHQKIKKKKFKKNNGVYTLSKDEIKTLDNQKYTIYIVENKDFDNYLYATDYTYTDIIGEDYYYNNDIKFKNVICKPEIKVILNLDNNDNNEIYDLKCDEIVNKVLKCNFPNYGKYKFISNDKEIIKSIISNYLTKAEFKVKSENDNIKLISTNNFYFTKVQSLSILQGKDEFIIFTKENDLEVKDEYVSFNLTISDKENYMIKHIITNEENQTISVPLKSNIYTLILPQDSLYYINKPYSEEKIIIQFKKNDALNLPDDAENKIKIDSKESKCKRNETEKLLICNFSLPNEPKEIDVEYTNENYSSSGIIYINYYDIIVYGCSSPIINLNIKAPLNLYNLTLNVDNQNISDSTIIKNEKYKNIIFNKTVESYSTKSSIKINNKYSLNSPNEKKTKIDIEKVSSSLQVGVSDQIIEIKSSSIILIENIKKILLKSSKGEEIASSSKCTLITQKTLNCKIDIKDIDIDLNDKLTLYYENICNEQINSNQQLSIEKKIFIKAVNGNMKSGKEEEEIELIFSTDIIVSQVKNVTLEKDNIKVISNNCYDNDQNKTNINCVFNLKEVKDGEYTLKSFSYKSKDYILNGDFKIQIEFNDLCPEGTFKVDNNCNIPEKEEDFQKICENENACNGKGNCISYKYSFKCDCYSGWTGIYCETRSGKEIDKINKLIQTKFKGNKIILNDNVNYIKEINYLIKENNRKVNQTIISYDTIIYNTVIETINHYKIEYMENIEITNLILLLDISIFSKSRYIQIKRQKKRIEIYRVLDESYNEDIEIKKLEELKTKFEKGIQKIIEENTYESTTFIDSGDIMQNLIPVTSTYKYFISSNYKNNYNRLLSIGLTFDLNSCINIKSNKNEVDKIIVLIISTNELSQSLKKSEEENSYTIQGLVYDYSIDTKKISSEKISSCSDEGIIYFPLFNSIDFDKYFFYKKRNIDIFNYNDPAFSPCYSNSNENE